MRGCTTTVTLAPMTANPDPRAAYAEMTKALIDDFRANSGRVSEGRFVGRSVLLLHTRGARSGQTRLAPLVYSSDGDRFVVMASRGGAPSHPAWYLNLVANPTVTLEVGGETFQATATVAEGEERERLFAGHADLSPVFRDYQGRTSRVIPVVVLERIREG